MNTETPWEHGNTREHRWCLRLAYVKHTLNARDSAEGSIIPYVGCLAAPKSRSARFEKTRLRRVFVGTRSAADAARPL